MKTVLKALNMATGTSELTIGEMISQVPEGQTRLFNPSAPDGVEERYFQVRQSWDYQPGRIEWLNSPHLHQAPWPGSRKKPRTPLTMLAPPEVSFIGPSKDVVDFYSANAHAFFISDAMFQLIDGIDPNSLEHVAFRLRAEDAELPFHVVMPRRALAAIDTRSTKVLITFDRAGSAYARRVRFPDGIIFSNEALAGVTSFSDIDALGWYWSKDLIDLAKAQGMRGLYAQSVASVPPREIARL